MRTRARLLFFAICLLPSVLVAHQQASRPQARPERDPSPQTRKTGTARLSGQVTVAETGRPIRRAVVSVSSPALRDNKSVLTDADGRWTVRDLPAGRFTVSVSKAGYVRLSYGQRRPFEAGKGVDIAAGQSVEKLDVALPRGSAVTGRVLDEFGEPLANASVSALRYAFAGGQRRLLPTGNIDRTDDLGQFRVHGLAPGDYYISARPNSAPFLETSESAVGYAETFYPGSLNIAEATRIHLEVGQEAQSIFITLTPTRVATISGTATTSDGKPVNSGMIWLHSTSNLTSSGTQRRSVRDGRWTFEGIRPGEYQLALQHIPDLAQVARTGTTSNMKIAEVAQAPITVTGEDMSNIALVSAVGGRVTGRVRFEGGPPTSRATIRAVGFLPGATALGDRATPAADGSFSLTGLSGRLLIRPSGLPPEWLLESVSRDGQEIVDTGFDIAPGQEISGLEVVLTRRGAQLSGSVQTSTGAAVTDYSVVLFSSDREKWGSQTRFVKAARPDQMGRFRISGMPAGSYLAVALDYLEPGQEADPDFLARIAPLGRAVRLAGGEAQTVALKLSSR